jgi:Helix-turn-helix domain
MAKSSRGQKLNWYKTLRGAELTSGEFRILVLLSTYTNEHLENAHPGVELLAQDAGMTVRGVQLILRSLEDKGAILVTQEGGNKTFKGAATVYALQVSLRFPRFSGGSRSWSDWAKGGADCEQTEQVRA